MRSGEFGMRLTMRLTVKSWLKFVTWVHGNDPNSNGVPFNSPGLGAVGFSGRGNPTAPYPGSTRRDIIRSNPERVSQGAELIRFAVDIANERSAQPPRRVSTHALPEPLFDVTRTVCKTRSGFDEYRVRVVTQGIASSEWPRSGAIHSRRCPGLLNRTPLEFIDR